MDLVTGAKVAVELLVPVPRERMWALITGIERIGDFSPEAHDGDEPGTTVVHHSFTHRPGNTGLREGADIDLEASDRSLAALCHNMTTTINVMITAENTIGANR